MSINSTSTQNYQNLFGAGITYAQISPVPDPSLLSNQSVIYQTSDGKLWQSNGSAIVAFTGGGGGGTGGISVPYSGTSLTINSANSSTYNGNTIVTSNASPVAITVAAGAALTAGLSVLQDGAGIVTIQGSGATINPVNGATTAGLRTTISMLQESTDVYAVLAYPTADRTLVNAVAGATPAVDMSKYNVVDLTLTANCTPAFSGSVSGQAYSVTLILRQDGTGGWTLTLPTNVTAGGVGYSISSAASAVDVITLTTVNGGSSYFLFVGGKAFA